MRYNYSRNILLATVVLMISFIFIGCTDESHMMVAGQNPNVGHEDSFDDQQPVEDINNFGNEVVEEEEPFLLYKVSEKWARIYKGAYMFSSNNAYYSLNDAADIRSFTGYGQGWNLADKNVTGMYLYADIECNHVLKFGDFDIPVCTKNDELRSFDYTELTFVKVHELGYSVPVVLGTGDYSDRIGLIEDMSSQNYTVLDLEGNISQFTIKDGAGNSVEDLFNMKKDDECVVSWYAGTDYHEVNYKAFCKAYELQKDDEIVLEGKLNEEGYATYNTLKLPKGTYWIKETSGMVVIE